MFDSSSTAKEVLGIVAKKINLNDTSPFALYILVGNNPDHGIFNHFFPLLIG
jgi:hypothetical protein